MKRSLSLVAGWLIAGAFLLVACAPAVTPDLRPTERVLLPGPELCGYAPDGATLTLAGALLRWTCEVAASGPRGLIGAPEMLNDTDLRWRLVTSARAATGGGFELLSSEALTLRVVRFATVDDTTCAFAGNQSILMVSGERVTYTCVGNRVALGGLEADALGLSARVGMVRVGAMGVELVDVARVRLRAVELQDPHAFTEPVSEDPQAVEESAAVDPQPVSEEAPAREAEEPELPEPELPEPESPEPELPEPELPEPELPEASDTDEAPPYQVVPLDPAAPSVADGGELAPLPTADPELEGAAVVPVVATAPLLGTLWGLQSMLFGDGTILTPDRGDRYTMLLGADGSALLQVDCNRAVGRFELDGQRLGFSSFAMTRAFCPDGDLETVFVMRVQAVVGFAFAEGNLLLKTGIPGELLFFEPLR